MHRIQKDTHTSSDLHVKYIINKSKIRNWHNKDPNSLLETKKENKPNNTKGHIAKRILFDMNYSSDHTNVPCKFNLRQENDNG